MKKKNIDKIANAIYNNMHTIKSDSKPIENSLQTIKCDKKTTEKFYKFILKILKLNDKLSITVNPENISIYGDLSNIIRSKSSKSMSTSSGYKTSKEDVIEISINKVGFRISRGYSNSLTFSDTGIFDRLLPDVINKNTEISINVLNELIDDVLVQTNLCRESNIDDLLNDTERT